MARKGITSDMVANAARAIKARGQEPTIVAIRLECGNEGSFSTISAHLAKWRSEEADKVELKSLPNEVEEHMMTAMMTIWNIANKQAGDDILAIKQEYADEKKRMLAEIDEAREEIKTLEKVMNEEEERANKHLKENQELKIKLAAEISKSGSLESSYKMLTDSLKQPKALPAEKKADGTKSARPQLKVASHESKQA